MLSIYGWGISFQIAHRWLPEDFPDDKLTLVQVMAWCRQATSHYMSQFGPRSLSPNGVTRPQWVNYIDVQIPSALRRHKIKAIIQSLTTRRIYAIKYTIVLLCLVYMWLWILTTCAKPQTRANCSHNSWGALFPLYPTLPRRLPLMMVFITTALYDRILHKRSE